MRTDSPVDPAEYGIAEEENRGTSPKEDEELEEEEPEDEKPELHPGADPSKTAHGIVESKKKCPEGGELGLDFRQYDCGSCQYRRTCQRHHNNSAHRYQEKYLVSYLMIEAGLLFNPELTTSEALLLSYISFRCQNPKYGYCDEPSKNLARILRRRTKDGVKPIGRSGIIRVVQELVNRGYLANKCHKLPRSQGGDYRTSRRLSLTRKAIRYLNAFRNDFDKLYRLDPDKGILKRE